MIDADRAKLVKMLRAAVRQVNFHVLADVAVQGFAKSLAAEFGISEDELLSEEGGE